MSNVQKYKNIHYIPSQALKVTLAEYVNLPFPCSNDKNL